MVNIHFTLEPLNVLDNSIHSWHLKCQSKYWKLPFLNGFYMHYVCIIAESPRLILLQKVYNEQDQVSQCKQY